MISTYLKQTIFFLGVLQITNLPAFDCSVIYDEFDSLMHKDFLVSPENYVPAISSEISFEDFNAAQRGKLYLRKDRPERGVGIVFTNDKLYGKFVFNWTEQQRIIIEDIIIYNRVEDGYSPFHHGPITIIKGEQIDLDTGKLFSDSKDGEIIRTDLVLSGNESGNPTLKSINQARVYFPIASLCE